METSRRATKRPSITPLLKTGDIVRVAKHLGTARSHREYRASFRRCAGRIFPIVGWDTSGQAWIPLGRGEVLSVSPELLRLVRRGAGGAGRVVRGGDAVGV